MFGYANVLVTSVIRIDGKSVVLIRIPYWVKVGNNPTYILVLHNFRPVCRKSPASGSMVRTSIEVMIQ